MKRSLLFAFSFCIISIELLSQVNGSQNLGSWYMYVGRNQIADKWSIQTDVHLRTYEVASNFQQLLIAPGINYHLKDGRCASLGYAHMYTESYLKDARLTTASENRCWQAYLMNNQVGRIHFTHRYMLEERWITSNLGVERYLTRARYLIQVAIPLNNAEMKPKTVFFSAIDDVMLHIKKNPFDQNRLFVGLGYQVSKALTLQAGYYNQAFNNFYYDRLHLIVFFNPDLRKKE